MIVAWTGHRPDLFHDPSSARAHVDAAARELVHQHPVAHFVTGGQRGVDTWAALAAIGLGVPFHLILPIELPEFACDWTAADRDLLDRTVALARELHVVGGQPAAAFTERNRLLATSADLLVAVWTGQSGGGTAETIALARSAGTPVREVVLEASARARCARGRGI